MLIQEFIDRTGYQPTAEEYVEIEKAYNHFMGNKDEFCRAWRKANPHKAGTLWAKIAENERVSKVFDKLVAHIVRYAKRKDFNPDMLYSMNYRDRAEHVDFVVDKVGARDNVDLWRVFQSLKLANAVHSGWSPRTWSYYNVLCSII